MQMVIKHLNLFKAFLQYIILLIVQENRNLLDKGLVGASNLERQTAKNETSNYCLMPDAE